MFFTIENDPNCSIESTKLSKSSECDIIDAEGGTVDARYALIIILREPGLTYKGDIDLNL
jgi:hypothetical protein